MRIALFLGILGCLPSCLHDTGGSSTGGTASAGGGGQGTTSSPTTTGTGGTGGTTSGTTSSPTTTATGGTGGTTSGTTGGTGGTTSGTTSSSSTTGTGGTGGGSAVCGACPAGQKRASTLTCTPIDDPDLGCAEQPTGYSCESLHPSVRNARWGCANGACIVASCRGGFEDCNNDLADGCEASLMSAAACGSCGVACGGNQMCTASGCASACPPPGVYCNGACVDLDTDPLHCGSCPNACPRPAHGEATCAAKACGVACDPGYVAVGGKCADTAVDPTCCGSGCAKCTAPHGGEPGCAQGACGGICPPGMIVCGGECVDPQRNVSHCGVCGAVCTGICTAGACDPTAAQVIATGVSPTHLVADGTSVFWVEGGTSIMQVDRGGLSAPISLGSAGAATSLAVDATAVYWGDSTNGGIWRAAKGVPGAVLVSNAAAPQSVTTDAGNVYWAEPQAIYGVAKAGGSAALLASGPTYESIRSVGADGTHVFWRSSADVMYRVAASGGTSDLLGYNVHSYVVGLQSLVFVGTHAGGPWLWVADKAGQYQVGLYQDMSAVFGESLAADADYAYFSVSSMIVQQPISVPGLFRVPLCGGLLERLGPAPATPDLAVDDQWLYAVDGAGAIRRIAK